MKASMSGSGCRARKFLPRCAGSSGSNRPAPAPSSPPKMTSSTFEALPGASCTMRTPRGMSSRQPPPCATPLGDRLMRGIVSSAIAADFGPSTRLRCTQIGSSRGSPMPGPPKYLRPECGESSCGTPYIAQLSLGRAEVRIPWRSGLSRSGNKLPAFKFGACAWSAREYWWRNLSIFNCGTPMRALRGVAVRPPRRGISGATIADALIVRPAK
mmetsp:Transcript_32940/g.93661  ORF Transcript_32940/g.93661 Transcript_32940/m.93661 type:complete len:213 (-) Transcript_32940:45-683(-)